jgi:hypothetical protein
MTKKNNINTGLVHNQRWYVWFEGLPTTGQVCDESILTLQVIEQDDLPGFLRELNNLNFKLVSIQKIQEFNNPFTATFEVHSRMTETRKGLELVEQNKLR